MHRHCHTVLQTSIHGPISGTPSLQQLLEERTPSTQTIVTCVRFCKSFYTVLETTMPMFGSTSGGKSDMASAPEKEDATASKGAKSLKRMQIVKPHAPHPHNNESTLREMSPQRSPSNLRTREHFHSIIWSRSHPHYRGWSQITHPTHLRMDRTYNL